MKTILLDDGFVVGSTSYCDVAAGLHELVGIYGSNRTCTVKQDSRHAFFFFSLVYFFSFSGIILLAVFTFVGSWCLLFCCLLCELGTIPSPQGGLLAVPWRARHTAVPDPY